MELRDFWECWGILSLWIDRRWLKMSFWVVIEGLLRDSWDFWDHWRIVEGRLRESFPLNRRETVENVIFGSLLKDCWGILGIFGIVEALLRDCWGIVERFEGIFPCKQAGDGWKCHFGSLLKDCWAIRGIFAEIVVFRSFSADGGRMLTGCWPDSHGGFTATELAPDKTADN